MSEFFDSDDPFADLTADDLDILENEALATTQVTRHPPIHQRLPHLHTHPNRAAPPQNAFSAAYEEPTIEDDYGQFNVDDEDLLIDTNNDTTSEPPAPTPAPAPNPISRFPSNIDQHALMEELAYLRVETSRLKLERDKYETLAYAQDGKMGHLQRTLHKTKADHELVISRLQRASESEKQALGKDLDDRDRNLSALTADIEFQKNELREARELVNRGGGIIRPNQSQNAEISSPKKAARIVKGSGVKSPEKGKCSSGVFSAVRAFSKEESIGPAKETNYNKKRKREEARMITPEPVVVHSEELSETDINMI